ncbi:hypothetical protein HGRIS_001313 [Hohenbuehelia grisea]|uniref:Uncharacterized protein n=1 Tax=Hohenbuehelia grisea TaxID=104357 RepID=A0ABR3JQT5_9AGAR
MSHTTQTYRFFSEHRPILRETSRGIVLSKILNITKVTEALSSPLRHTGASYPAHEYADESEPEFLDDG